MDNEQKLGGTHSCGTRFREDPFRPPDIFPAHFNRCAIYMGTQPSERGKVRDAWHPDHSAYSSRAT